MELVVYDYLVKLNNTETLKTMLLDLALIEEFENITLEALYTLSCGFLSQKLPWLTKPHPAFCKFAQALKRELDATLPDSTTGIYEYQFVSVGHKYPTFNLRLFGN